MDTTAKTFCSLALLAAACASPPSSESNPAGPTAELPLAELREARVLLDSGNTRGAIERLEALLAESDAPAFLADIHRSLAYAHTLEEHPERALPHLDLAIELAPADFWLHYSRGVALHRMGLDEEAISSLSRAIELNSLAIKAWEWRGYVRVLLRDCESAVADLTRALEITESAASEALDLWKADRTALLRDILYRRAGAYECLGRHEAARVDRARMEALSQGW